MRVLAMAVGLLAIGCGDPRAVRCTDNGLYGWCGEGTVAVCDNGDGARCDDGVVLCNDGSEPHCESTVEGDAGL